MRGLRPFPPMGLVLGILISVPVSVCAHGIEGEHQYANPVQEQDDTLNILNYLFGSAEAKATFSIEQRDGFRFVIADGLPDHRTGSFPNRGNPHRISEQNYRFKIPLKPLNAGRKTPLGHMPFGGALNGVVFDPKTAEYWNRDRNSGWNIDALSGVNLGLDRNNAHVQPNGAYHYHSVPVGLLEQYDENKPVLLGYAADGFPIYGPKGYAKGKGSIVQALKSSWRLKDGTRPSGPGGQYDGTYVEDYIYQAGLGDLDECNGRTAVTPEYPDGTYHYVITNSFPFIPRCFTGKPDESFQRRAGGGGAMGQGPRNGPRQGAGQGGARGRPDLNAAADRLGISVEKLRRALGPPPPDFEEAARKLGISADELFKALHP